MKQGRIILDSFESSLLKNNPLKDPHIRQLAIYLPPGYEEETTQSYPVVFLLPGFAGKGPMMLNREAFSEAIDERLNRLIASQTIQPMIVVMPDCFTYYGGSQYRNSPTLGQYESYLVEELVPYIKNRFRTKPEPRFWAIAGKSSGGYGALTLSMRHPDVFGSLACHSGDMGFEYCYLPDFPPAMLALEKAGGIAAFMDKFYAAPKKDGLSFLTLNVIAMAAAYSTGRDIELPFRTQTGEIDQKVWQQWLALDPINMIDSHQDSLQKLNIFIDCGSRDEYRLYAGARTFSAKLQNLGIKHIYEEFEDTHTKTSYRYDRSLKVISDFMNKA